MPDKMGQLQKEARSQMDRLKEDYFAQMKKLREIPGRIPREQFEREGEQIMARINDKMIELGISFARQSNDIMDSLILKLTEV